MNRQGIFVLGLILLCGAGKGVCAGQEQKPVFIAVERSAYKDALANRLQQDLNAKGLQVNLSDLKGLETVAAADYCVIIIINTGRAWHASAAAKKFIDRLAEPDKKKVVIFTTMGRANWQPKIAGVDTVSGASKMNNIASDSAALASKVKIAGSGPETRN